MKNPTTDECKLCQYHPKEGGFDWSGLWVNCEYEVIPRQLETDEEYTTKW